MYYNKAREFIYKNARPLDIARWNYLFEDGNKEEVLTALAVYQNEDGGFGSALEPDCWNPNSAPLQTWSATIILKELKLEDRNHPIIQGILRYLSSGEEFDGHTWANAIASNNDFPHAPWWSYGETQEITYNPTASFIGFIIKYAAKDSEIFKLACRLAKEAYSYFKTHVPMDSMHTVSCFVELYEYIKESSILQLLEMEEFKKLLNKQIQHVITSDIAKWESNYVCKPSFLINSKASDFYFDNKEICKKECEFILISQKADGSWTITWSWSDYPEQWIISKNWWKSDLIIKNIRYIKAIQDDTIFFE